MSDHLVSRTHPWSRTVFRLFAFFLLWLIVTGAVEAAAQVVLNEIGADNRGAVSSPGGTSPDYIELYNTGTTAVALSTWSLTDDLTLPAKFKFPATASIPAHGFLVVWLDSVTNYAGIIATNFNLKSSGEEVALFQGSTRKDYVRFGPQIRDISLGRIPSGTGAWSVVPASAGATNKAFASTSFGIARALRINEWLATNSAGATSDWLELYNPKTNGIVAIGSLVFSDLTNAVGNHALYPNSFIEAGGFLKFWCDGTTNNGNHLDIKLSSSAGETITLFQSNRTTIIDRISFGPQSQDISMGRLPDGGTNIFLFVGTNNMSPGAANTFQDITNVQILEVLSHTDPPLEDAIKLYNPSGAPVDISNWWLSNDREEIYKFRIPAGTLLPAGGFKVFYEQSQINGASTTPGFNRSSTGNAPDFTFNSAHGDVAVLTPALSNGTLTGSQIGKDFGSAANGISFGHYIKSDGGSDFVPLSSRTFGVENPNTVSQFRLGSGQSNSYPHVGPLVISEIMFKPPPIVVPEVSTNDNTLDEFIELTSLTNGTLKLFDLEYPTNRWRLTGAIDWVFPTNSSLSASGRLLLVNFDPKTNLTQLAAFRSLYSVTPDIPIFGPYGGRLNNSVATIVLEKPDPVQLPPHPDAGFVPYVLVEKIKYESKAPWPGNAEGSGFSIQRRSLTGYGNDQTNWFGAAPTAGRSNDTISSDVTPAIASQPQSLTVSSGGSASFSVSASGSPAPTLQWFKDNAPVPGATAATLTKASVATNDAGDYFAVASNAAGSATSAAATLTVQVGPTITSQPQSLAVREGSNATFTVTASGLPAPSFQWFRNSSPIPGATAASYTVATVTTNDEGAYHVDLANPAGAVASLDAILSVGVIPYFATALANQLLAQGGTVSFSAPATGSGPIQYQWTRDGQPLPGETRPTLMLQSVQTNQSGLYRIQAVNIWGGVTSAPALVSIAGTPSLANVARKADGRIEVMLEGTVGHTYEIEGTTDLLTWEALTRITNTLGLQPFTLPQDPAQDRRFYRVRLLP